MAKTLAQKMEIARANGLSNVEQLFNSATAANLAVAVACALIEKESGGKNVYGHDRNGALAGFDKLVTKGNFEVYWWLIERGLFKSNGVGPAQITSSGLIRDMLDQKLKPWDLEDNMTYGFRLLSRLKRQSGSWEIAGSQYNGSESYGVDLAAKIAIWQERFK